MANNKSNSPVVTLQTSPRFRHADACRNRGARDNHILNRSIYTHLQRLSTHGSANLHVRSDNCRRAFGAPAPRGPRGVLWGAHHAVDTKGPMRGATATKANRHIATRPGRARLLTAKAPATHAPGTATPPQGIESYAASIHS